MRTAGIAVAFALVLGACGGSYPAPTQRLADAMGSVRGAQEVGAASEPQAQLHLKLAQDELERARALMKDGDNRRADFMLVRAKTDAELALALWHQQNAKADADKAIEQVKKMQQPAPTPPTPPIPGGQQP